jgi:hypothetical protein
MDTEETDRKDPPANSYELEGPEADLVCYSCGKVGPFKIAAEADVIVKSVDDAVALVTVDGFRWNDDTLCKCSSCGLVARVGLFRAPTSMWLYQAEDSTIAQVDVTDRDSIQNSDGKTMVLVALDDPMSADTKSKFAVDPVALRTSRVGALEDAQQHLAILETLAGAMLDDVVSRLGEINMALDSARTTSSKNDATTEE